MDFHNILWTGGWDSTFRILDLVLNKKRNIQPYYILDPGRKSTNEEIKTMEKIKSMIYEMDYTAKERIRDTIFIKLSDIPNNQRITEMYNSIKNKSYIGSQYDWLSRFANYMRLSNLELCIHFDDKAHQVIKNDVEFYKNFDDSFYKLKENPSDENLKLFSSFHFPILNMTRTDMEKKAMDSGFLHIMEQTWFCHNPQFGRPCGECNPCKYTIEEGLSRRVPRLPIYLKIRMLARNVKNKIFN